jgi:hypothetical protein
MLCGLRCDVSDLEIGKTFLPLSVIFYQICLRHRRNNGYELLTLDLLEKTSDQLVFHFLMGEVDIQKACGISDDCMLAIENTDLHILIGRYIGHENADPRECTKAVLESIWWQSRPKLQDKSHGTGDTSFQMNHGAHSPV